MMPESPSNYESNFWDALYADVKFLTLEYKLQGSWSTKADAEGAIIQLLQYHGKTSDPYWRHIRTCRLLAVFSRVLASHPPDDVAKLVRRTDRGLFRDYQMYIGRHWNLQMMSSRQMAKKPGHTPYKRVNHVATREALKELAAKRPNTFRHLLDYLEEQLEGYRPYKPPAVVRVIRYMRDLEFDMEPAKDGHTVSVSDRDTVADRVNAG